MLDSQSKSIFDTKKGYTFNKTVALVQLGESDHANAIFRQFQDAIFSREHTPVKTLTKIIFDQEIATLSLPEKAAIASFI